MAEGQRHLKAPAGCYAVFTANIRKAIDAAGEGHGKSTADRFTELSRVVDKRLWLLEAHIQR